MKTARWVPLLICGCSGSLFASAMSALAAQTNSSVLELIDSKRPLVIAHRGYSQIAPENTLPAFQLAMDAAADLVELDYYHSQDGQIVVFHDVDLDRTTDATNRWAQTKIKVETKTAAELRTLDAGSWFNGQYAGTKIPLLGEALDLIQRSNVTLIERKAGPAADCVKLVREKGLVNKVVVQAFDWQYLRAYHEAEPKQVLGALGPPKLLADGKKPPTIPKQLSAAWLDELVKTGARLVVWNDQITKEAVELAHQRGLKVWVYTINDSDAANQLLDMGVDGLITNNVSLIWRVLALR